jgi:hypothetical protein
VAEAEVNALALIILALLTVAPGRYAPQLTRDPLGPDMAAQSWAEDIQQACRVAGVPESDYTALLMYESAFRDVVSPVGAQGPSQLLPGTPWHRAWLIDQARDPFASRLKNIEHGARALRYYQDACGPGSRAFQGYRVGHCGKPGPRSMQTLRLAHQIEQRLREMRRPLIARRLP